MGGLLQSEAVSGDPPHDAKSKEAYALGYQDGTEDALMKSSRDGTSPRSR
jgi:hypothetical protein